MTRKDQAHPLVAGEIASQLKNLDPTGGVHAVGWLVEDHQFRIMDDRRRDLEALLHAGGIGVYLAIARLAEPDVVEHFVRALHRVGARHTGELAGVGDEFHAVDAGEEAFVLRDESDLLADFQRLLTDIESQHATGTRIHANQAHQRADHRGFARAIGTEKPDRAARNRRGQAVERRDPPVGLLEVLKLEKNFGHEVGSRRRCLEIISMTASQTSSPVTPKC